jgi:hypothetical protein
MIFNYSCCTVLSVFHLSLIVRWSVFYILFHLDCVEVYEGTVFSFISTLLFGCCSH